jgi:hypothetical protein
MIIKANPKKCWRGGHDTTLPDSRYKNGSCIKCHRLLAKDPLTVTREKLRYAKRIGSKELIEAAELELKYSV